MISKRVNDTPSLKITATAMLALQESAESFITNVFSKANLAACHAKRITVLPRDIKLYMKMVEMDEKYNLPYKNNNNKK